MYNLLLFRILSHNHILAIYVESTVKYAVMSKYDFFTVPDYTGILSHRAPETSFLQTNIPTVHHHSFIRAITSLPNLTRST